MSLAKNNINDTREVLGKRLEALEYELIDPLILLHYHKNIKIVEDPLFYSSKNSIIAKEGEISLILRESAFSGLEGKLHFDQTSNILFSKNGRYLLDFLSIFSGRLYELRSKYLFDLLPTGYAKKIKNSLIGYHYPEIFRSKKVIGRYKGIHEIKNILEETFGINNIFILTKYKMVNCYLKKNHLWGVLGNVLLGGKLLVKNLEVHFYFNSLLELNSKRELLNSLKILLPIYSPFYTIKTYINNEVKIKLGEYVIGYGQQKTRNKRLYHSYDETHVFLDSNTL